MSINEFDSRSETLNKDPQVKVGEKDFGDIGGDNGTSPCSGTSGMVGVYSSRSSDSPALSRSC